jgi:hypothetical protein
MPAGQVLVLFRHEIAVDVAERHRFAARLVGQAAKGAVERALELVAGTGDGLVQVHRVFVDDDRRVTGNVRFHHAAVAAVELLLAVLIAQVNVDAVTCSLEAADGAFHDGLRRAHPGPGVYRWYGRC